jgi:hypothetical protein
LTRTLAAGAVGGVRPEEESGILLGSHMSHGVGVPSWATCRAAPRPLSPRRLHASRRLRRWKPRTDLDEAFLKLTCCLICWRGPYGTGTIAEATRLLARAARQQHPGPLKGAQTRSCSLSVLMEEAAEQVASVYNALVILVQNGQLGRRVWRLQQQRPVGTVAVVVPDVDAKDLLEVAAPDDQQPVQALDPDRPHPALGVRVRPGCPHRRAEHLATVRAEHLVETAAELGVPIVDKEAHLPAPLAQHQQEVAGLLGDPAAVRVGGHTAQMHMSGCRVR